VHIVKAATGENEQMHPGKQHSGEKLRLTSINLNMSTCHTTSTRSTAEVL